MKKNLLSVYAAAMLMAPATAYAYIDPSAGQSLIQILIAAVAAGAIFFRVGLKRIVKFFSRSSSSGEDSETQR